MSQQRNQGRRRTLPMIGMRQSRLNRYISARETNTEPRSYRAAQRKGNNSLRKPSARRTSPFKQMMRKQTISPRVAEVMRGLPEKGDRRRTRAERIVSRAARGKS